MGRKLPQCKKTQSNDIRNRYGIVVSATLASLVYNETSSTILEIVLKYYGLIGIILSSVFGLVCYMVAREGEEHQSQITTEEITSGQRTSQVLRNVAIQFFIVLVACLFVTPYEDVHNWISGNIPEAVLVALGFGTLALSALAQAMADQIKNKYLSNHLNY